MLFSTNHLLAKDSSENWQQEIDSFFGKYAVKPLVSFLFWGIPGTEHRINEAPVYSFSEEQILALTEVKIDKGLFSVLEQRPNRNLILKKTIENQGSYNKIESPQIEIPFESLEKFQSEFIHPNKIKKVGETHDLQSFPLVVAWLLGGALFFTFKMRFVNLRFFATAIALVSGKRKKEKSDAAGEVTHFQALTTALSATVGLGNIAGVAIAIGTGGPGATFWMIVVGFLGMSSKFTECLLGQKYRKIRKDGKIMGGAMHYLSDGLKELKIKRLGGLLAGLFCVLCIGASFGGGNAFQVVQSLDLISTVLPILESSPWIYGLLMTFLVGLVIIGGIKSIAKVASRIVPAMCGIYLLACSCILIMQINEIPRAIVLIFESAFTMDAGIGGFLGILIIGVKRAVFSNGSWNWIRSHCSFCSKGITPSRGGNSRTTGTFY